MPEPSFVQRFLRERALSRYLAALERGDINAVITILDQASKDGALEQMIFDLHETYQTEEEFLEMAQEVQDEPNIIEIENGVFKSRLEGKLPALRRISRRKYRVYERVLQLLVAALLVICVLGSVFLAANFQQSLQNTTLSSAANRCMTAGAPISAYNGTPIFRQIAAVSPDNIWVVGSLFNSASSLNMQPLLEHWDGTHWAVVPGVDVQPLLKGGSNGSEAFISRLAVLSANDIWAVGGVGAYSYDSYNNSQSENGQPLIEHWNGWQWQLVPAASGITASYSVLNDLVAVSANDIWAVGYASNATGSQSTGLIEHWDGSRWTRVPQKAFSPSVGILDHVRVISTHDIWIFGRASPLFQTFPLVEHWDGHTWAATSLTDTAGLSTVSAVATLGAHDIWVAGNAPLYGPGPAAALIVHWNGQRWSKVAGAKELGAGITLQGLAVIGSNDIWSTGSAANGRSLILHWDGQHWNAVQHVSPPLAYLTDLTVSGGKILAVGGTYNNDLDQFPTGAFIETGC